jgi:hypothetical protein
MGEVETAWMHWLVLGRRLSDRLTLDTSVGVCRAGLDGEKV